MTNLIGVEIVLSDEAAKAAEKLKQNLIDVVVDDGTKIFRLERRLKRNQGGTEFRVFKGNPHILNLDYMLDTDVVDIPSASGFWEFAPIQKTETIIIRHDGHYTDQQLKRMLKNRTR